MAIQGQNGVTRSLENGVSLMSDVNSVALVQELHEQFSCGNDFSLKVRKPYTITKQRERWTDEEHQKFLEALKLYGRAWRKIEEHIGTKTAVQIRSHAQKFFSKVIRDTNGNNTTLEESIEIPPPRPKRKPTHPYPRKLVEIPKNEISNLDHPLRSNSLMSLDFGQENKSPNSVLSAVVSETLGSSDSDTLTGSLSPVSSISAVRTNSYPLFESKSSYEEDMCPEQDELNDSSTHADNEQSLVKLEIHSNENVSTKDDDAAEESPRRTFKLFGTTLLVIDRCEPFSTSTNASKPIPSLQIQSGSSDIAGGLATIVPWWTFSHNLQSNLVDCEDKEVQNEGSCAGSNTSSSNDGDNNERLNDEAKIDHVNYLVGNTISESMRLKTFGKGFVPYKRCIAERENQCSSVTYEEREGQRIRLSL